MLVAGNRNRENWIHVYGIYIMYVVLDSESESKSDVESNAEAESQLDLVPGLPLKWSGINPTGLAMESDVVMDGARSVFAPAVGGKGLWSELRAC